MLDQNISIPYQSIKDPLLCEHVIDQSLLACTGNDPLLISLTIKSSTNCWSQDSSGLRPTFSVGLHSLIHNFHTQTNHTNKQTKMEIELDQTWQKPISLTAKHLHYSSSSVFLGCLVYFSFTLPPHLYMGEYFMRLKGPQTLFVSSAIGIP